MKKQSTSYRFALRAAAAVVAVFCLSPLAAVAQDYARLAPEAEISLHDGMPAGLEPRTARPVEVQQPAYRLGYVEYEGNDAGEQTVIPGFDWRSPTTGLVQGYDD